MSGDHNHGGGALRAGARHQKRLLIAFVLIAGYFVIEAIGGLLTNSLALLSDAEMDEVLERFTSYGAGK